MGTLIVPVIVYKVYHSIKHRLEKRCTADKVKIVPEVFEWRRGNNSYVEYLFALQLKMKSERFGKNFIELELKVLLKVLQQFLINTFERIPNVYKIIFNVFN